VGGQQGIGEKGLVSFRAGQHNFHAVLAYRKAGVTHTCSCVDGKPLGVDKTGSMRNAVVKARNFWEYFLFTYDGGILPLS